MFSAEAQAKKSISCRLWNLKYIADNPGCYKKRKTWKGGISRFPYAFEFNDKCKQEIDVRDHCITIRWDRTNEAVLCEECETLFNEFLNGE